MKLLWLSSKPRLKITVAVLLVGAIVAAIFLSGWIGNTPIGNDSGNSQILKTAIFDFDSNDPPLNLGQNTPFSVAVNGVLATFKSPTNPAAFSVQSASTTSFKLSKFSGKYLFDNDMARNPLIIEFNRTISSISISFATIEYHGAPGREPTPLAMSAYLTSKTPNLVATVTARGSWPVGDSFPQGSITFNSSGEPFNLVRIDLVVEDLASANDFLVDDIVVTFK